MHVACCPLVSHVEDASRAVLRLKDGTGGRTDGQDGYIMLATRRGQRNKLKPERHVKK